MAGFALGRWVGRRRGDKKKGQLTLEQIKQLEAIKGWSWNPEQDNWNQALKELQEYVKETGHAKVPYSFKNAAGFALGYWVSTKRRSKKKGQLTPEQIKQLEAIKSWLWDAT